MENNCSQTSKAKPGAVEATALAADVTHVMDFAPCLIYVFDQIANVNVHANRSIGEMMGYSLEEVRELGADLMPTLIHPEDLPAVFAHFATLKSLEDGKVAALEYRCRHKDGNFIWLLSHDSVFQRDANGTVTQHIGTAMDITAQKAAEAAARFAETTALASNAELTQFSYSVSHDLKAPANTLELIISEIREELGGDLSEDMEELLRLADTTVLRMGDVVDAILEYSETIGTPQAFEEIDLNTVFQDIQDLLMADIVTYRGAIEVAELPTVRGIPMQVQMLFQNLIQNALKFHKEGQVPHVSVHASKDLVKKTARICVADQGIGIPETKQEEIFDLFKRLNRADKYGGSGIGLATCKRIALNHSTHLTVASKLGQGTTFTIEFELA